MKFQTILEGQQALILNHLGEGRVVVGPKRVYLFRERVQLLHHFKATHYEYLYIKWKDGSLENKPGPCEIFHNPLEQEIIRVKDATKLNANQVLVVYKTKASKGETMVERRIVWGPTVFVPAADEWLHEFIWHGANEKVNKTVMIAGYNRFTKLTIIPGHFYYNVREVRTYDDTQIVVKLMLFYELKNIEKMYVLLSQPPMYVINSMLFLIFIFSALCADVVAFAAKLSYEEFQQQAGKLNSLNTYPQLMQRSTRIGYEISKVVYRGYHAGEHLQLMQDNAIKSRTELKLNTEIQEGEQKIADYKIRKEQARSKEQQEMENRIHEHKQKLEDMKQECNLQLAEKRHIENTKLDEMESKMLQEIKAADDARQIETLNKLEQLGVDMTKYLVNRQGSAIDQEVQFC
ncbi:uncharacterized protein LOC102804353 [Saccoglossus kowalevskii]